MAAVATFVRQLSTLLQNGVPLLRAMETLSQTESEPKFRQALDFCILGIQNGSSLSAVTSKYPGFFPEVFVTMVRLGERTGELEQNLEQLADWLERDDNLRRRVSGALHYPGLILGVASLLTLAMFRFILPGLLEVLRELKAPLPLVTRVVMAISDLVQTWWAYPLAALALVGGARLFRAWLARPGSRARFFQGLLQLPSIGPMLKYGSAARYCFALRSMFATGVTQVAAFPLASAVSGSPLLEQDSQAMLSSLKQGLSASEHMTLYPQIYPRLLTQMLCVGEQTGHLEALLGRAGHFFTLELENSIELLSATLEPFLLVAVAGLVATLLLSIFLPLYGYLGTLGG